MRLELIASLAKPAHMVVVPLAAIAQRRPNAAFVSGFTQNYAAGKTMPAGESTTVSSRGLFVTGIVSLSLAPVAPCVTPRSIVAVLSATSANYPRTLCDNTPQAVTNLWNVTASKRPGFRGGNPSVVQR